MLHPTGKPASIFELRLRGILSSGIASSPPYHLGRRGSGILSRIE